MGCCASQQELPAADRSTETIAVSATLGDLRPAPIHTPVNLTSHGSGAELHGTIVSPSSLAVHSGITNRGPSLVDSVQYVPLGNPFSAPNNSGLGSGGTADNLSSRHSDFAYADAELASEGSAEVAAQ